MQFPLPIQVQCSVNVGKYLVTMDLNVFMAKPAVQYHGYVGRSAKELCMGEAFMVGVVLSAPTMLHHRSVPVQKERQVLVVVEGPSSLTVEPSWFKPELLQVAER